MIMIDEGALRGRQPWRTLLRVLYALTAAITMACEPAAAASTAREREPLRAVPGAMRELVPSDTVLYVDAASADALHALVAACATVGTSRTKVPDARELLASELHASIDRDLVDTERPAALALRVVNGSPQATWILPVSDTEAFAESARAAGMQSETSAGWVAVADEMRADPLACALTFDPLPGGVIAARIDIPALVAAYRPLIDMGIQNMRSAMDTQTARQAAPGFDLQALIGAYVGMFDTLCTDALRLDLVARSAGTRITIAGRLEVSPDGPLVPFDVSEPVDLHALAGTLDPESMVRFVGRCDMAEMMRRAEGFMQVFAASDAQAGSMLSTFTRMYATCTGDMAQSFDFSEDGMRMVARFGSRDPGRFIEESIGLVTSGAFASLPGSAWDEPVRESLAGFEATRLTQRLPESSGDEVDEVVLRSTRAMTGGDGEIVMRYIALDDSVLSLLGDVDVEQEFARIRSPLALTDALAVAIEAVGDAGTAFAAEVDLSGFIAIGISGLPPEQRPPVSVPEGRTSVTVWVAGRDDGWDFEIGLDLAELKGFVGAFTGR